MNMRNATCVRTQTSKDPTRVAILFISYSMVFREFKPYGSNESDLLTFVTDFCTLVSCDHSMVVTSMTSIIDQYSPVA